MFQKSVFLFSQNKKELAQNFFVSTNSKLKKHFSIYCYAEPCYVDICRQGA